MSVTDVESVMRHKNSLAINKSGIDHARELANKSMISKINELSNVNR